MPVRCVTFEFDVLADEGERAAVIAALGGRYTIGLVGHPPDDLLAKSADRLGRITAEDASAFWLSPEGLGFGAADPRTFTMAAAASRCYPNEVVHVTRGRSAGVDAVLAVGGRAAIVSASASEAGRSEVSGAGGRPGSGPVGGVTNGRGDVVEIDSLDDLPSMLERFDDHDHRASGRAGVGPRAQPWPDDQRLDPELLAGGDRRNVVDGYRYWREEAILADLEQRRHGFHVAVENWRHDRNIGAVVRNANAFGAAGVHIVGRRRWNRRGAMATDRYLPVRHHEDAAAFVAWAAGEGLPVIGIDNVEGSMPLEATTLPERCVLVFGQEGPGLSAPMIERAETVLSIAQFGSTRSINAGVASGIAMHAWVRQHADLAAGPTVLGR